jgi:hypothetical protein
VILEIDRDNLKQGVLGLVMAIVEIIRDALRTQAFRRIEAGNLTDEECERLGRALHDLDVTIDSIKQEQGLEVAVRSVREGLDEAINGAIQTFIRNPRWLDEYAVKKERK